jgi:hypothetical protein
MNRPPYACINTIEAQVFSSAIEDDSSRSALMLLHNAFLELTGNFRWRGVTDHLRPSSALDELAFYKAVAATFERKEEWEAIAHSPIAVPITQSVVNARQLAGAIDSNDARNGILAFINIFTTIAPADQDAVFCVQMLIPIIFNDEWLPKVLNGEVAKCSDAISNDFDKWADGWV